MAVAVDLARGEHLEEFGLAALVVAVVASQRFLFRRSIWPMRFLCPLARVALGRQR